MKLQISRALVDQMIAHAAADPAREVCGLLFGEGRAINSVQPCANVSNDPASRFEVDPAALMLAHKAARAGGVPMIGCYHSHPNGDFALSEADRANAYDGQIWVLIAGGRAGASAMQGGFWTPFEQLT